MEKFEVISLTQAETMSENKLQIEIGKRTMYLRETLGMDKHEAANFTTSLLNMGVAMNRIFEEKKAKKK